MRRFLLFVVASATLFVTAAWAAEPAAPEFPGESGIHATDLMRTVTWLASPALAGRVAGSPGYMSAARGMAARFRQLGLKPGGEGGFYQRFDVEYAEIPTCALGLVRPDGSVRELELGTEFTCRGWTGSGDFTAPVVFAGYGISEPARGYDDYAGLDARGKVVLAIKAAPPFRLDSLGWGDLALPRPRGRVAAAHGARGLLLTALGDPMAPITPIGSVLEGPGPQDQAFPRLMLGVPAAEEMVAAAGLRLADLRAAIDSTHQPHSRDLGIAVRVRVRARYQARRPSANVVGILAGADPALRDQYLVIGAHLDHVGRQGSIYFPGANDNASGAAAVAALAAAFARADARPRRSVVFVLFSSEESGLDGSKHFVAHPPVPRSRIVAYLNLDCVGVGDSIQVGSGETSPKLWKLARDLDADGARLTVAETWGGGGADAAPFAGEHIPTAYFVSRFSYPHLHQVGDTPATLNPTLYEALVRLVYRTAWRVAEGGYSGE